MNALPPLVIRRIGHYIVAAADVARLASVSRAFNGALAADGEAVWGHRLTESERDVLRGRSLAPRWRWASVGETDGPLYITVNLHPPTARRPSQLVALALAYLPLQHLIVLDAMRCSSSVPTSYGMVVSIFVEAAQRMFGGGRRLRLLSDVHPRHKMQTILGQALVGASSRYVIAVEPTDSFAMAYRVLAVSAARNVDLHAFTNVHDAPAARHAQLHCELKRAKFALWSDDDRPLAEPLEYALAFALYWTTALTVPPRRY